MASDKPCVLALHGYLQNAQLFREKSGSVRKALKKFEWVYVDAPFPAEVRRACSTIALWSCSGCHGAIMQQEFDDENVGASGGTSNGGLSWWQW
jgi:hypothetical protein